MARLPAAAAAFSNVIPSALVAVVNVFTARLVPTMRMTLAVVWLKTASSAAVGPVAGSTGGAPDQFVLFQLAVAVAVHV